MITFSIIMHAQSKGGENDPSLVPDMVTIQDTFFGLKMKDRITSTQIKFAVGSRGVFNKETRESNSIVNSFTDVYFAGNKWAFANFICTDDGKFYGFNAYNSFNNYSSDQEKDAKSLYENFKSKLDYKYGNGKEQENEDGSRTTTYLGSNDMVIILFNSVGGSYRRYVGIEYTNLTLFINQMAENDDEL